MDIETIIGIDLSGPASEGKTAVVSAVASNNQAEFSADHGGSNHEILELVTSLNKKSTVIVGIDAPLSYQPGGGQRERDADLRRELMRLGLPSGSVMAPTFRRMAWLTLRGIGLAHALRGVGCHVVEVHPSGALALHGAPIVEVRGYRDDPPCRRSLLAWLRTAGLRNLRIDHDCSSHYVAACAAVLAAHAWWTDSSKWCSPAEPPWHPYDFAC